MDLSIPGLFVAQGMGEGRWPDNGRIILNVLTHSLVIEGAKDIYPMGDKLGVVTATRGS